MSETRTVYSELIDLAGRTTVWHQEEVPVDEADDAVRVGPPRDLLDGSGRVRWREHLRIEGRSFVDAEDAGRRARRFLEDHAAVLERIQPCRMYGDDCTAERRRLIFVVVGPSGVGKTALVHRLLDRLPGLCEVVSYTSRPMREGEVDGEDYHFVDRDEAQRMEDAGEFVDRVEYHGNLYGVTHRQLAEVFEAGDDAVIIMERKGLARMRSVFGDRVRGILVVPPNLGALADRLRSGGRADDEIERRLETVQSEIQEGRDQFDAVLVNDRLDEALVALGLYVEGFRRSAGSQLGTPTAEGADDGA